MKITTTKNGFNLNSINYTFESFEIDGVSNAYEILSDSQMLSGTNDGLIFLDLSLSINDKKYENIDLFINALYQVK
jgi:hypothetical protein